MGKVPPKRHTIFKSEDDQFYYEQLFGTEGFHGIASLLYHTSPDSDQINWQCKRRNTKIAVEKNVTPRMIKGQK